MHGLSKLIHSAPNNPKHTHTHTEEKSQMMWCSLYLGRGPRALTHIGWLLALNMGSPADTQTHWDTHKCKFSTSALSAKHKHTHTHPFSSYSLNCHSSLAVRLCVTLYTQLNGKNMKGSKHSLSFMLFDIPEWTFKISAARRLESLFFILWLGCLVSLPQLRKTWPEFSLYVWLLLQIVTRLLCLGLYHVSTLFTSYF